MSALVSELPRVNGWSIARHGGDRTPDRTQRLLNHASWDTSAAMSVVRRFAARGLEEAARRGRRGGMVIGAIDETGQEKAGRGHRGSQTPVPGVRGPGGQRDQHRAPVLRAGEDRARADRRPAVDPARAHRRPGEVPAHGAAAGPGVPHQGAAGHRHLHGRRTPTASASISPAGTRSTAAAPSCASSSRPTARRTYCGCRRTSPSPWPRARS